MNKSKIKRIIGAAVAAVLIVVISAVGLLISKTRLPDNVPDGALRAVFFDVGEADCTLFFNSDTAILTDAPADMTNQAVGYMKRAGIKRLDFFVISHYDSDHCGDAERIINEFEIDTIILPEPTRNQTEIYEKIVSAANEKKCITAKTGQSYETGGVKIDVLSPNGIGKENNDICLSYRLTYKNSSVLMCSDITADEEKVILSKYGDKIKSDIIKVAHHGSKYSSTAKFIKPASAKYAVISCGRNTYGHPATETLDALKAAGSEIFITQAEGVIIFDILADDVVRVK